MEDSATKQTPEKCWVASCALVTALCGMLVSPVLFLLMTARYWFPSAHYHWISGELSDVAYTMCAFGEYFLPPICGSISIILAHIAQHWSNNTNTMPGSKAIKAAKIVGYATIVLWFIFFHLSAGYSHP